MALRWTLRTRHPWRLFPGNYLGFERATLHRAEEKTAAVAELLPFAPAIIRLEEDRVQMRPQEPRDSATIVAAAGEQAASIQADLEARMATEEVTVCPVEDLGFSF